MGVADALDECRQAGRVAGVEVQARGEAFLGGDRTGVGRGGGVAGVRAGQDVALLGGGIGVGGRSGERGAQERGADRGGERAGPYADVRGRRGHEMPFWQADMAEASRTAGRAGAV